MDIDIRTLVLMLFIVNVIKQPYHIYNLALISVTLPGSLLVAGRYVLQTISSLLLLLRGNIPAFISIVVSNVFAISGTMLVLNGLERFFGLPKRRIYNYILISIFTMLMCYFTLYNNSLMMRDICISSMIVLINAQSCWLLLRKLNSNFRKVARVTAYTLLIYIAYSLLRVLAHILLPPQSNEFFRSGIVDSISLIMYISLSILITAGFTLMVSRRLLDEVQTEKGKYISAFHSSPYAILLTKVTDGTIFEVNDGFVKMSGYQPEEVIGKTTIGIGLWADADDRRAFISDIQNVNEMRDREVRFRKKNGETIIGCCRPKRYWRTARSAF
jgi:PAS domain S-box-containing protein